MKGYFKAKAVEYDNKAHCYAQIANKLKRQIEICDSPAEKERLEAQLSDVLDAEYNYRKWAAENYDM